jgi:TPR repeat protein
MNPRAAFTYYKKAASLNNPKALCKMGDIFFSGNLYIRNPNLLEIF